MGACYGSSQTCGTGAPGQLERIRIQVPRPESPPVGAVPSTSRPQKQVAQVPVWESLQAVGPASPSKGGKRANASPKKSVTFGSISQQMFILEKDGDIKDHYDIDLTPLGQGSYGVVSKGKHMKTEALRAIKTIEKKRVKKLQNVRREIDMMKVLDHPNIVKLYETFGDTQNIYLVMELCAGGELFDRILESGSFSEVQAATLMQQVVRALYYMHENHICHRDLKPENFLLQSKDAIDNTNLKIIDFGLSCRFEPGKRMKTKAGTPFYIAPQVLQASYTEACDLWSCGVTMYVLLCGYPPFYGETDTEVLFRVRQGNFRFPDAEWGDVSEDAKGLIRLLLKMNPKERHNAEEALNHPWIKDKAPKAEINNLMQDGFVEHLRSFQSANQFKKAALHIIAGQLSDNQIKALRETFVALDENGDGLLTWTEIQAGLRKAGLEDIPMDLQQVLTEVDSNGSGVIDYTEFLAATLQKKLYIQEDVCRKAFDFFDQDGNGKISRAELNQVLRSGNVEDTIGRDHIDVLMKEVDGNGDGLIDFEEFMDMMRSHGSPCHQAQ